MVLAIITCKVHSLTRKQANLYGNWTAVVSAKTLSIDKIKRWQIYGLPPLCHRSIKY